MKIETASNTREGVMSKNGQLFDKLTPIAQKLTVSILEIIKVDSDVAPKIARHYGVRSEPEFVFCLYGDEVLRQIGPNQSGLTEKLDKMVKLGAETENEFLAPN